MGGTTEVQNMLLLDVAPLSLGLETAGGMMQKLIERNSTIPTNKSQDFTTTDDYQDHVDIAVYEGERTMVKDNNYLGKFTLTDIPKTLRGVPKIKVTFNIDPNGILEITAEDVKSHPKSSITITNEKGRLSQNQIEKMLDEADKYKDEDELAKGEIVAKESLKAYVVRLRKAVEDITEDKLLQRDRDRLFRKVEEAEEWIRKEAAKSAREDFEAKQKELEAVMYVIMLRINRTLKDFWEDRVDLAEGQLFIEQGGFFLASGLDIRELIEDPD